MGNRVGSRYRRQKSIRALCPAVVAAMALVVGTVAGPLRAQSSAGQAPPAAVPAPNPPSTLPSSKMPDWQIAAGGKLEFDVASVKPDAAAPGPETTKSNIPLGPQDIFSPTGGLLSATNIRLLQYVVFAYKLTPDQVRGVESQMPKWVNTVRYDIQARASGNPTKDQFRLMMQALLADRFKLAIHYEVRQLPVMALVLDKAGKLGPHLRPHPDDAPCSTAAPTAPGAMGTVAGEFPEVCGGITGLPATSPGRIRLGARDIPMLMIATSMSIPQLSGVDRPVIDKTGLTGKFDFVIEFTPQINGPLPPGVNFQPDESGPTFLEALKEQLGLKLDSQTGPVDVVVVDHVEQPSEN